MIDSFAIKAPTLSPSSAALPQAEIDATTLGGNALELFMQASISAIWSACNYQWDAFKDMSIAEIGKEAEINEKWLQATIVLTKGISEHRYEEFLFFI